MNLSWNSQNSPGFVYFDTSTSTDFIPFDSTSTPTKTCEKLTNNSPFNKGEKQRFYNNYNSNNNSSNLIGSNKKNSNISFDNSSSPISFNRSWNKTKWNSFENYKNDSSNSPYNRRNYKGGSYNQRLVNNSKGNCSKSFSFTDCKQKKQYDINMYVHPSFLENPWEELENQHKEKKESSLSDQGSS